MAVPRKRLQNNTVYVYFCVYITTDVAGDFLKSFYWDNHSCLQWRLGDLVAGKGQMWKRDQAQSWVENISCGGGKKKKKSDSGKKCETKEPFIYFPKKFHPKIDSSEFMKFAHGQPVNQKWKRTGPVKQAAGEAQSLPAPLLTHQPAWKGLVKFGFLATASEVDVVLILFVCFCWGKGALLFKHGQLDFQQGTSPPALLYQTLCSSVTWHRYYFFWNYYDDLDVLFSLLPHNWAYLWSIS